MGKPSSKIEVVEYTMSVHIGVAYALDAITGIYVNEKEAWSGRSDTQEDIFINQPELFGGPKKEGGLLGYACHLPGRPDQVVPDHLAARYGKTAATSPGYRGLTSLFFVGGGPVASGQTNPFLEAWGLDDVVPLNQQNATSAGFSWSYNSPIIAQTVWIKGERAPGNGPGSQVILDPELALIGPDANPAHIICDCLTNTAWGMGAPASTIDIDSFNDAAATLAEEEFGLSITWVRQAKIEDFIAEVQDHVQGVTFLNPASGKWEFKLLRDDYDVGALPTIDASNGRLKSYRKRMWGEAGNQVTVTFTNAQNGEEATISAEDLGAINSQGGSPVNISRNYYGIRNAGLAYRVAQRDVRSAAAALLSATVEVHREFWDIKPFRVVLLNWPEKHIHNAVMRVMNIDRGTIDDGWIKLSLLEDVFSLDRPPVTSPQDPQWEDPGTPPEPIDAVEIITLPSYFALSADLQTAAVDLEYPEVLAAVLAYSEVPDVRSYGLFLEEVTAGGGTAFRSQGTKSIVERSVLPSGLAWETLSRLPDDLVLNRVRGPRVGGFVFFGSGSDAVMEIAQVTAFDEDEREWVISRGVLDTVPRAWTSGTPIWFVNPATNIVDEVSLKAAGETVEYKILPRTSKGVLPLEDADPYEETLTARPHLPLRPANVKVNGTASGSFNGGAATTLTVTWATRNRTLEDGQVVGWTSGTVAPEYEQGTVVSVYDQDDELVYEQWGLWTEQELVLQRAWFDRYSEISIRVSSRRRDLDSLQGHVIGVTGLANNPAADPPPTPPEPGPPPSPDPAPANGAWSATGTAFVLNDAGDIVSSIPAILVSGARDRVTAVELIVRYKKSGTNDWLYLPGLALTDQPTQVSTTAVIAQTDYDVEVAYRSASNILSAWRSLGEVTTGRVVADGLRDITAAQVAAALGFLGDMGEAELEALGRLQDYIRDTNLTAEGLWAQIVRNVEDRERFERMIHEVDPTTGLPVPIGTKLIQERETRVAQGEAFDAIFTALGAWNGPDKSVYILNGMTVWVDDEQSFAEYQQALVTRFQENEAAFTEEVTVRATADGIFAQNFTLLGGRNGAGNAWVINDATVQLLSGGTVASRFSAVAASAAAANAAVVTEATARATADTALASQLTTVSATVGGHTTSISQLFSADSALGAKYGLRLNVNGHVTGFIANNDGTQGSFTFVADSFAIATSGGAVVPFSVVGSQVKMTNVEVDTLKAGIVTTDKLVGGAVSAVAVSENGSPSSLSGTVTHLSFSFNSTGGVHVIDIYGEIGSTDGPDDPIGAVMQLNCNGSPVGAPGNIYCPGAWGGIGLSVPVAHQPGAGAFNYSVTYTTTPGSGAGRVNRTFVRITELKR